MKLAYSFKNTLEAYKEDVEDTVDAILAAYDGKVFSPTLQTPQWFFGIESKLCDGFKNPIVEINYW